MQTDYLLIIRGIRFHLGRIKSANGSEPIRINRASIRRVSSVLYSTGSLSICVSVYLFIYIYIHICVIFMHTSTYISLFIHGSIYLPIYLSIYIGLSFCLSLYVCKFACVCMHARAHSPDGKSGREKAGSPGPLFPGRARGEGGLAALRGTWQPS